uniref:Uncharacterized protein n=1 Tax=Vespula pensylvanica TaxID=30213 RepID=A0A834KRL2_VESPE|nr:hypothetical protein H0235_013334 [Vespula pensylvanica]
MASRKAKQSETIEKEGADNREGEEDEATTSSHCASRRAVLVFLRTSCWAADSKVADTVLAPDSYLEGGPDPFISSSSLLY